MNKAPRVLAHSHPMHMPDRAPIRDQSLLHAYITPNISMSPTSRRAFVCAVAGATLLLAAGFVSAGLWPIGGYFALVGSILLASFLVIPRQLDRLEEVILVPGEVVIRRYARGIFNHEARIAHLGLAVGWHEDPDFGCLALTLRRRGREIEIARDLSPQEHEGFRAALLDALHRAGAKPRLETTKGLALSDPAAQPSRSNAI